MIGIRKCRASESLRKLDSVKLGKIRSPRIGQEVGETPGR